MKIVMASLDGKDHEPLPHDVGHSSDSHPGHRFQDRVWNTEGWSSLSGTLEDKKADDEIAYSGPDDKLGKSTFPKTSRKGKAFETAVYPSASVEAKVGIPGSREAWRDHRLHTERVHTDKQHYTFVVAPRHRDSSKNMTTGASQADMTLIMVCVSTRPAVQRETIV